MRRQIGATAVFGLIFAGFVAAQSPTQDRPATTDQMKGEQTQLVTVEGCLVNQNDVPGTVEPTAKPTERSKGFVLTNVKFTKGAPEGYVGTTGNDADDTSAGGKMFAVKGLDSAQLTTLAGKRVEIEGSLTPGSQAKEGMAAVLPAIQASTIKQAAGECKAPER